MSWKLNPFTGKQDYYVSTAGTASVTSADFTSEISNRISDVDALSANLSLAVSALQTSVQTASAAATSVAAVASLAISVVSAAAAALSLTVSDHETRINTLSQSPGGGATTAYVLDQVSALSSKLSTISAHSDAVSVKGLQSAIDLIVNRVSVNSAVAGGASAGTSAAVIADARSAIAVLSVDTSANITSQVAAHSTTQKTDVASMIAVLSVSVSADITSQVNALSNALSADLRSAISVLSSKLSNISARSADGVASVKGLQSAVDQLSNRISGASQALSAHSVTQKADITSVSVAVFDAASANAVSIVNAHSATIMLDARSADTALSGVIKTDAISAIGVLSAVVSLLSINVTSVRDAEISNRNSAIQVASAAVSLLSINVTSVRDAEISNRNSAVQVASAAATSIGVLVSTLSARFVSALGALSQNDSTISVRVDTISNALSTVSARNGGGTSGKGLQTAFNQVSNKISATALKTYTWVLSAPAVGGLYGAQMIATVKAVKVIAATISASTDILVNVEKRPTFGAAGSNVLSADIDGSATPVSQAADTSAGAATITAGSWLYLDISGTSGTPACGIVVLQVGAP